MKISSRGWLTISILFSLAVIVIVFIATFNQDTIGYILNFNLAFLCLAIIIRCIALVLWGLRIHLMARSLGYRVRLPYCVNMVLAGLFAGTITPGQVGGEPVRVHELYKDGVKLGDATAVVIMERVLDGIVLTIMGVLLMTLMTSFFWTSFSLAMILLIIVAWAFMISFILIPVFAIRYPEGTKRVLMRLIAWLVPKFSRWITSQEVFINRADKEISNLCTTMARFTGTAKAGLISGGVVTLLFWISEFLVASVIMMGLGLGPAIIESFFFQILIAIINMIPLTPGSSGIVELSTSSLYALLIPSGMIGIFVLLWRFVTFYLNIVLGAFAGVSIFKREIDHRKPDDADQTQEKV